MSLHPVSFLFLVLSCLLFPFLLLSPAFLFLCINIDSGRSTSDPQSYTAKTLPPDLLYTFVAKFVFKLWLMDLL